MFYVKKKNTYRSKTNSFFAYTQNLKFKKLYKENGKSIHRVLCIRELQVLLVLKIINRNTQIER